MFGTRIYIASVEGLKGEVLFKKFYEKMPDYRRKKIDSCADEKERRLSLGAGILLSFAVLNAGYSESELEYGYRESGMPFFKNEPNLFFSLSKSEEKVMCAVSSDPIGVDVEFVRDSGKDYDSWIKAESYAKATDTGLSDILEGKTSMNSEFRFFFPDFGDGYKYAVCSEEFLNDEQFFYIKDIDEIYK